MVEKNDILNSLKKVIDPETGVDIVSMGLIKDIEIINENVKIKFSPTVPFCPLIGYLTEKIKEAAKIEGIKNVEVEVVL
jgi:metal-sulfur cluster biosynthetic enzyme